MRSQNLLAFPFILIFLLLIYGFGGQSKWPGGSPGGYTGSPGDGRDCTQCHGGSASQVLGWISANIPEEGYIPGETYNITIHVSGTGDKGFEVSPQDLQGNLLGSLQAGTNTHLVNENKAVTQNSSTSANPAQWQFQWTAPPAGTGEVTFYGAFTVNKPVTKLCKLVVQENTGLAIREQSTLNCSVYPNPASDKVHISFQTNDKGLMGIDLVSIDGKKTCLLSPVSIDKGDHLVICHLPDNLPAGIYFLNVFCDSENSFVKIAIH
jgi:hypothetical protein